MSSLAQRGGAGTSGRTTQPAVLAATDVHKSFGGIHALRGASLELLPGEVHGLIGENGSGKSTLLSIIAGQTQADAGKVLLRTGGSGSSLASRVAIVTQELSLVPDLSIAENILLGHNKPRTWYGIQWNELARRASLALERLGLDVNPWAPAGSLRVDQQQLVEIARVVETGAPVIILDEPTSSLTEEGVESLAQAIRKLRDHGTAVVFVSHKIDEMFALTDRVTVLRDGRTVLQSRTADLTKDSLVEAMLGYAVEHYAPSETVASNVRKPALQIRGLSLPGRLEEVDLSVAPGQVVGIVGLAGSGKSELMEAAFGLHRTASGLVEVGGSTRVPRGPRESMTRGMAMVPGDRKRDGLLLGMSITDNVDLAPTACHSRLRRRRRRLETSRAKDVVERIGLQRGSLSRHCGSLSGGNQQKVLLARWLATEPSVLLLDDPTRGVDVGAKREVHTLIHELRDEGMAVVVSSSDIEELMVLCDVFVVLFRGRVVGTLAHQEASEAILSHLATGGSS